jgi:hypothetical protein
VIIVAALIASDWRRRVTSSTTTGERGSESNNVAIGNTDADEPLGLANAIEDGWDPYFLSLNFPGVGKKSTRRSHVKATRDHW